MPISTDATENLTPLVELATSLGLANEHHAALLDAFRRQLAAQEHRLRAELDIKDTGLGTRRGERILPLREAERRHLTAALEHTRGKIYGRDGAAKLLDLKPTTLQSKLKKHGIDRLGAAGLGSGEGSKSNEASAEANSETNNETKLGATRIPTSPAMQASAAAMAE